MNGGGGFLGIEEGEFNHEWAGIFTNGEGGMGNGGGGRAGGATGGEGFGATTYQSLSSS